MTRLGPALRTAAALVALLALVVGLPAALALWGTSPVRGELSMDAVREVFEEPASDRVIAGLLTVAAWCVWALFLRALAEEVIDARRTRSSSVPVPAPRSGPLRITAHALVVWIAMTVGSLAPGAGPRSTPALRAILPDPAGAAEMVAEDGTAPAPPTAARPTAAPTPAAVALGEGEALVVLDAPAGVWELAERHLGDGMRWRELWSHNRHRAQPDGRTWADPEAALPAGWRLVVPADGTLVTAAAATPQPTVASLASSPAPSSAPAPPPAPAPPVASQAPGPGVEVAPGDNFWSLAEHTLATAWDRPPTEAEVRPYWQALVESNRDRLVPPPGDPNLIFPGQVFVTPTPGPDPMGAGAPAGSTGPAVSEEPAPAPAPGDSADTGGGDEAVPAPDATVEGTTPAAEAPPADGAAPAPAPDDQAAPAAPADRGAPASEAPPTDEPTPAGDQPAPETPPADQAAPTDEPVTADEAPPSRGDTSDIGAAGSDAAGDDPGARSDRMTPATDAPVTTTPPATEAPVTTMPPATDAPAASADAAPRTPADSAGEGVGDDDPLLVPSRVITVGGSALLAGLVLAALARRRRIRRNASGPDAAVPPVEAIDPDLEQACSVSAGTTLDRASAAARALGPALAGLDDPPAVTALVVEADDTVVIHLDAVRTPEPPFEPGPVVTSWALPADRGDAGGDPVLDSLVAVCRTDDGAWVCLDVESLGAVEVSGDPRRAEQLVRSMAAELAMQPAARLLDLTVVGLDTLHPGITEQAVQHVGSLDDDLVRGVERSAAHTADMLDTHGLPTTVAARSRGLARDGLVVAVVVAATDVDEALLDRVAGVATPGGRGVGVVSLAPVGIGAARLHVDEEGRLQMPHLGATGTAARLYRPQARRIGERLAAEPESPDTVVATVDADQGVEEAAPLGSPDAGHDPGPASTPAGLRAANAPYDQDAEADSTEPGDVPTPAEEHDAAFRGSQPGDTGITGAAGSERRDPQIRQVRPLPGDPQAHQVGPRPGDRHDPHEPHVRHDRHDRYEPYEPLRWSHRVSIWDDHAVHRADGTALSFRYGDPGVPNKNTRRGPELISYLAHSPGRSASELDIAQHLWWQSQIARSSVDKLIYGTRKVLGGPEVLSHLTEERRYRLADTVVTDAQVLSHALRWARRAAPTHPDEALDVLRDLLDQVRAIPWRTGYAGQGISAWAWAHRVYDKVEQTLIDAAVLAADLSAGRGAEGLPEAIHLLDCAARACPTNEPLVRAAMTYEARLGHRDAVNYRYIALAQRLAADELEPDEETVRLRASLLERNQRLG